MMAGGLSLGLALGLSPYRGSNPLLSLFANGENGFLVGPFVPSGLFQDSAGTVPVTADTDPVGRVNDKSGNGNNPVQSTNNGFRPLYGAGPNRLVFDGVDDRLRSGFIPTSSLTLAVAAFFPSGGGQRIVMGGGASTGNLRAFIGISTAGSSQIRFGWGTRSLEPVGPTGMLGAHRAVILSGRSGVLNVWIDGTKYAPSVIDGPNGGGEISLGAYNNNGSQTLFWADAAHASLALDREITDDEAALITTQFQRTYE